MEERKPDTKRPAEEMVQEQVIAVPRFQMMSEPATEAFVPLRRRLGLLLPVSAGEAEAKVPHRDIARALPAAGFANCVAMMAFAFLK